MFGRLPLRFLPLMAGLLSLAMSAMFHQVYAVWETPVFWAGLLLTPAGVLAILQDFDGLAAHRSALRTAACVLGMASGLPFLVDCLLIAGEVPVEVLIERLCIGAVPMVCGGVVLLWDRARRRE